MLRRNKRDVQGGLILLIAVLVKQVPAVDTVKIDEKSGTMVRDGVEAELNPPDLHAVEAAVSIKEKSGCENIEITAFTMGPPQARKVVSYAVAMGCDKAVLISDRKFGGADTLATARTLSKAIMKEGPFDLIFAGERATDGETGQVGPAVAEFLHMPVLTFVSSIESLGDGMITVVRSVEGGREKVAAPLPAFVIPVKEINTPRLCTLSGKLRAKAAAVTELNAEDIGLKDEYAGLKGSATQVVKVTYPKITRKGRKITAAADFSGAVETLLTILEEKGFTEVGK